MSIPSDSTDGGSMRFRLLHEREPRTGSAHSAAMGGFFPSGGVRTGDSHEDVLTELVPAAGRWIVLCEDDGTFRMFTVRKCTKTDIEAAESPLRLYEVAR